MWERRVLRELLCPDAVPRYEVPCAAVRGIAFRPRTRHKVALAACCAAALLISACSGLPYGAGTSGSPQSNSSVNCQALARQGVTVCPPANPDLGSPRLVNHSDGLASSAQFNKYARGLLRNFAFSEFALNTSQASILRLGILATPHATDFVYSGHLATIASAKQERATLTNVQPTISTIKLVVLSPTVQGYIRTAGWVATRLAWIVVPTGPSYYFTTKGSSFTVPFSVSAAPEYMYWGTYHGSTDLGPIWTFDGSTSCGADPAWQAVCDQ